MQEAKVSPRDRLCATRQFTLGCFLFRSFRQCCLQEQYFSHGADVRMLDFSRHRNIYTFLITLLFLIGIKFAISYTTTSSFFRISIDAEASSDRKFTVYYSANSHLSEKKSQESGLYLGGERDTQTLTISNNIAKKLRLDLGNSPGTVRIYSIKLTSFFFPELIFHPQDIARDFLPVKDITTVKATPDYVEIVASGSDPYMQYKGNLQGNSFFLDYILPLVFTFCFYLFLSSFVPADFPAFADCVAGRASSSGAHFASLDGIRGIAALIVLMEHTGVMSGGIGSGIYANCVIIEFDAITVYCVNSVLSYSIS